MTTTIAIKETLSVRNNQIFVSSRDVAEVFGKRHDNVLKAIENLNVDYEFRLLNFEASSYLNEQNKAMPEYLLTRDGFTLLVMGFTGAEAMQFKIAYIQAFNEMEKQILSTPKALSRKELALMVIEAEEKIEALALSNHNLQVQLDEADDYYSVKRMAKINDIDWRRCDWRELKRQSAVLNKPVIKIFDANYGEVNTYHISVWHTVYPKLIIK